MTTPRLVILESPFAATSPEAKERNIRYARAALRDCLLRGEAPMASHMLYTQEGVLQDVGEERRIGILAGLAWGRAAEATVVYKDLGISAGMQTGIARAKKEGRPIEMRTISGWENEPPTVAPRRPATPPTTGLRRSPGHEGPGSPEGPRAAPARAAKAALAAPGARGAR